MNVKAAVLPEVLWKKSAMTESKASEVMSPRLPAIGVAMLSGFMCSFFDSTITAAVTRPDTFI